MSTQSPIKLCAAKCLCHKFFKSWGVGVNDKPLVLRIRGCQCIVQLFEGTEVTLYARCDRRFNPMVAGNVDRIEFSQSRAVWRVVAALVAPLLNPRIQCGRF